MTNNPPPNNAPPVTRRSEPARIFSRQEALLGQILSIWFWAALGAGLVIGGVTIASGFAYQYVVLVITIYLLAGCLYWARTTMANNPNSPSIDIILALLLGIALELTLFFHNGFYAIGAVSFLSILVVTVVNRTGRIMLISGSSLIMFLVFAVLQNQGVIAPLQIATTGFYALAVPLMVSFSIPVSGLLMLLLSNSLRQSLTEAENRGRLAEESRAAQAITLAKVEQQAAEQARLIELVHDLEIPVIPLMEGVLVLPIVGHLDSGRMSNLTQTLLQRVAADHAHTVLLDLTAISLLDTQTANHLLKLTSGVRLLGARCILSGIRADVAQTLVSLGISWGNIQTVASLRDGVAYLYELQQANAQAVS